MKTKTTAPIKLPKIDNAYVNQIVEVHIQFTQKLPKHHWKQVMVYFDNIMYDLPAGINDDDGPTNLVLDCFNGRSTDWIMNRIAALILTDYVIDVEVMWCRTNLRNDDCWYWNAKYEENDTLNDWTS